MDGFHWIILRGFRSKPDRENRFLSGCFFRLLTSLDRVEKEWVETAAKKIDVVVTMRAATIARNWGQFMEFMLICSKKNVEVVCIDKVEDAQAIFRRIQEFKKRFFEGSDVTCE